MSLGVKTTWTGPAGEHLLMSFVNSEIGVEAKEVLTALPKMELQ